MATYALPDFVAKPKPRLDHRGFREQGSKVAEERIKKLRSRLSWLDGSEEQLKTEQQRLCTSATRELDDAVGLQHSSDFNKGVDREDLKELIPKVVDQFNKTKSALMKETNDIQDLGGKPSHLPRDVSSMKETRTQSLIRKQRRKRKEILDKTHLDDSLRDLRSRLKALKGMDEEGTPGEEKIGEDVDRDYEADLRLKIQEKREEIKSCQERINKLNKGIEKLNQQNKESDEKIEEEEQGEDENVKLSTKRKEQKERQEIEDQKEKEEPT